MASHVQYDHHPDVERDALLARHQEWKPSKQEWLIMLTLATASFMVALDATIIITSLSVRLLLNSTSKDWVANKCHRPWSWHSMLLQRKVSGSAPLTFSHLRSRCCSRRLLATSLGDHTYSSLQLPCSQLEPSFVVLPRASVSC